MQFWAETWGLEHMTWRSWVPFPQETEHGVQGPALHADGHARRLQARFPAGRASPQRLLGTDRCCCWPELDACWQLTQRRCHPVWPQEALQSSHSPVTHRGDMQGLLLQLRLMALGLLMMEQNVL